MMNLRKLLFLGSSILLVLALLAAAVFGQVPQKNDIYRYLSIFSEVFSLVRSNYVEDVPPEQLVDGAFAGVTDAIDEFSYYIPPNEMASYKSFTATEHNGIGLVMTKRYGYAYIISSVSGSPANEAGIEAGDFIERIDGQPTQKMSIWQIQKALSGADGTIVKLQVLRGGMSKRAQIDVTRKPFAPAPMDLKYLDDVAYIKVPYFTEGSAARFSEKLDEAKKSGRDKLIVDLRGNAGGSVDEAIAAADALLSKGTITSLKGRRVDARTWAADPKTGFDGTVEVLTDNSTAAGAEVFAAGIAENRRGQTVGIPTFGKAIVQKLIPLPSGGALFMTIGHFTTPELKPIKERGIRPDVLVDLAARGLEESEDTKNEKDLILEKALALIRESGKDAKAAA